MERYVISIHVGGSARPALVALVNPADPAEAWKQFLAWGGTSAKIGARVVLAVDDGTPARPREVYIADAPSETSPSRPYRHVGARPNALYGVVLAYEAEQDALDALMNEILATDAS